MITVTESLPPNTEPQPTPSDATAIQGDDEQQAGNEQPLRIRYRIRFAKTQLLRWISHKDLARLWERLVRRARLKPSMTEGFHPKPRIGFPSALALGVESLDEVVELELAEDLSAEELFQRLRSDNQPGLTIKSVSRLPDRFGKAQLAQSDYVITAIESADAATICQAVDRLKSLQTVSVERKNKTMTFEVATQISNLELADTEIHLSLTASESATLRPVDVLDLLGFGDWIEKGSLITRVRVLLRCEFETNDPTLIAVAPNNENELKQENNVSRDQ
jgi:radical SAM-linked protein